jgi:hypothetical protein
VIRTDHADRAVIGNGHWIAGPGDQDQRNAHAELAQTGRDGESGAPARPNVDQEKPGQLLAASLDHVCDRLQEMKTRRLLDDVPALTMQGIHDPLPTCCVGNGDMHGRLIVHRHYDLPSIANNSGATIAQEGDPLTEKPAMHIAISMLLASGSDRPLLERVCKDLDARIVDDITFQIAAETPGCDLLFLDPMRRAGVPLPTPGSLGGVLSAAEAPGVSRVIIVTNRVDADGDLRRLRRSGARYVIVRAPLILDHEMLRSKSLLVPRDLATTPLVTLDDVSAQVRAVLADHTIMGQTIEIPASSLENLAEKPKVVAPWRAKLGRWLKQPVLDPISAL